MRISILTIGAVASIITINSVFADTTVTSKQYVDTTRQATIPRWGTNYGENGRGLSVVTYTDNAGVLGERYICDVEADWDCTAYDLVTWDLLKQQANQGMPEKTVTKKTCVAWLDGATQTDANCILWNLSDESVYGKCETRSDCSCYDGNGRFTGQKRCENYRCVGECLQQ